MPASCPFPLSLSSNVHFVPVGYRAFNFPVSIIFAVLETGYYAHYRYQDTQLLLKASLLNGSWSRVVKMLLYRHDYISAPK